MSLEVLYLLACDRDEGLDGEEAGADLLGEPPASLSWTAEPLILSRRLVFPVSTCPSMQTIGCLKVMLNARELDGGRINISYA